MAEIKGSTKETKKPTEFPEINFSKLPVIDKSRSQRSLNDKERGGTSGVAQVHLNNVQPKGHHYSE